MIRIRMHGRGGQGIKTAARVLGTTFFLEGYTVQDSPRYGAERRGAPIVSYVRAGRGRIDDRGVIQRPDLVIVTDETLLQVAAAEVLAGMTPQTALLLASNEAEDVWRHRLGLASPLIVLRPPAAEAESVPSAGMLTAGAAAALFGLDRGGVERAARQETADFGAADASVAAALDGFDRMADRDLRVREGAEPSAERWTAPGWVDLAAEDVAEAAPAIHATLTSEASKTGLWRTMRPVVDPARCHHCWWVCSTLCPDNAIPVGADGAPSIDYDHCKGCLVCVAVCPHHAIAAVPEPR